MKIIKKRHLRIVWVAIVVLAGIGLIVGQMLLPFSYSR